jgi:hypothetical protein
MVLFEERSISVREKVLASFALVGAIVGEW